MKPRTIRALQHQLAKSLAAGSRVEERLCEGIVDPVFVVDPPRTLQCSVTELLDDIRKATDLYPVFIATEWLDDQFHPRYSAQPQPEWTESFLTLLREAKSIDPIAPAHAAPVAEGYGQWLLSPVKDERHPLAEMALRLGAAPTADELLLAHQQGALTDDRASERWLLDWEQRHVAEQAWQTARTWHLKGDEALEPWQGHVVLLALGGAWQVFAHMHNWWGMQSRPAEKVAAMRSWQQRYGVELLSISPTTLSLRVQRRPMDLDEAFGLAIEHDHFAGDTLGRITISLREHARALCVSDIWFFHDRP